MWLGLYYTDWNYIFIDMIKHVPILSVRAPYMISLSSKIERLAIYLKLQTMFEYQQQRHVLSVILSCDSNTVPRRYVI